MLYLLLYFLLNKDEPIANVRHDDCGWNYGTDGTGQRI